MVGKQKCMRGQPHSIVIVSVCVLCVGVRACVQLHPPLSLSVSASRVECINRPDLQCMDSADWNVCSYQIFERLV